MEALVQKRKPPHTQAAMCTCCQIRPAVTLDLCKVCDGRLRRDAAFALRKGLEVRSFAGGTTAPPAALETLLPSLDALEALLRAAPGKVVSPMPEGAFMQIFRTEDDEVWFRYTFRRHGKNDPFAK